MNRYQVFISDSDSWMDVPSSYKFVCGDWYTSDEYSDAEEALEVLCRDYFEDPTSVDDNLFAVRVHGDENPKNWRYFKVSAIPTVDYEINQKFEDHPDFTDFVKGITEFTEQEDEE